MSNSCQNHTHTKLEDEHGTWSLSWIQEELGIHTYTKLHTRVDRVDLDVTEDLNLLFFHTVLQEGEISNLTILQTFAIVV